MSADEKCFEACPLAISHRRKFVKKACIAILTVICGYFTVSLSIEFFRDPLAVKITEQVEKEVHLPEIMICPMDPLNITKLKLDGYPNEAISVFHWHFIQDDFNLIGVHTDDTLLTPNVTHFFDRLDWGKFMKSHGPSCEALFVHCTFNYAPFECCSIVHPILHEKKGLCYKFFKNKYPGSSMIFRTGAAAGLKLILNVPHFNRNGIDLVPFESGLLFEYGHELNPPFTLGSHPYIRLPINFSTEISLSRTYYDRIYNEKNPCTNHPRCVLDCLNEEVQRLCNCSLLGFTANQLDEHSSEHACSPLGVVKCYRYFNSINHTDEPCAALPCYVPCKEWVYTPQVTVGNLNGKLWEVSAGTINEKF